MAVEIVEPRPAQALEFWDELEPHIARALAYDVYNTVTIPRLLEQVGKGFARVLVCSDGEAILSVTIAQLYRNTLDERILHVIATGGEQSNRWLGPLRDRLVDMATEENCAALTMAGRPGWVRKLAKLGFRTDMVSMRLEVDDGRRQIPRIAV